jgi:hypothetical protein
LAAAQMSCVKGPVPAPQTVLLAPLQRQFPASQFVVTAHDEQEALHARFTRPTKPSTMSTWWPRPVQPVVECRPS